MALLAAMKVRLHRLYKETVHLLVSIQLRMEGQGQLIAIADCHNASIHLCQHLNALLHGHHIRCPDKSHRNLSHCLELPIGVEAAHLPP